MNKLIKHTMDNYELAKHWYWELMVNDIIPNLGIVEGLPEDEEERMDAISLFVITACEVIATGNATVQLNVDEAIEAQQCFKILMSLEKQSAFGFFTLDWNKTDEDGMPAITISDENIKAQAEYFNVPYDENNKWATIEACKKQFERMVDESR